MDSSRFGSKEVELFIAHDMQTGVAAYLPPLVLRELCWRKELAGAPTSNEDRATFARSGLKNVSGMRIYDTVRNIEHVLHHGLGLSLADFQLPSQELRPLQHGWLRVWSAQRRMWVRISVRQEDRGQECSELPLSIHRLLREHNLVRLKFLCLTLDQVGYGWSAAHNLLAAAPGGQLF